MLLSGLVVFLGAAPRLLGGFSDLWFDEIWSLQIIRGLASPVEIFTGIHHSNNHHLYSLFFYFLPNWDASIIYRIPSLVAGLGTIVLAGVIARRRGATESLIAMVLVAGSYLMTNYSTEARGYAPVVFLALAAFLAATKAVERLTRVRILIFTAYVVLGFLSHLEFVHVWGGILIWTIAAARRGKSSWSRVLRSFALLNVPSIVLLVVFYLVDIAKMKIGGAPIFSLASVLRETAALTLGAPLEGGWPFVASLIVAALFVIRLWKIGASRSPEFLFYVTTILLAPAATLLLTESVVRFPRYFLIAVVFFLILLSHLVADLLRRGVGGRVLGSVVLLSFLIGNARYTADLIEYGHGEYARAVRFLDEHTSTPSITVGSDHLFRNKMMLEFYGKRLKTKRPLQYIDVRGQFRNPPEWFMVHEFGNNPEAPPIITVARRAPYKLVASFPCSKLSGWHWYAYRRMGRQGGLSNRR